MTHSLIETWPCLLILLRLHVLTIPPFTMLDRYTIILLTTFTIFRFDPSVLDKYYIQFTRYLHGLSYEHRLESVVLAPLTVHIVFIDFTFAGFMLLDFTKTVELIP